MAFTQFKSLGETLLMFSIVYHEQTVVKPLSSVQISSAFVEQMRFALEEGLYRTSEYARCESLIFPILQEVWKPHRSVLRLWSHVAIAAEEPLTGTPDYVIATASPLGNIVLGKPLLAAVEAKRENFDEGWAQCTAEMLALQRLNHDSMPVWGIVTNGELWQFGKLMDATLMKELSFYAITDLNKLFDALAFVLEECRKQVETKQ